jgi:hypothetical protein
MTAVLFCHVPSQLRVPVTQHEDREVSCVLMQGLLQLHSHRPAILHRDLKSPNLLVDKHWRVKVIQSVRWGAQRPAIGCCTWRLHACVPIWWPHRNPPFAGG